MSKPGRACSTRPGARSTRSAASPTWELVRDLGSYSRLGFGRGLPERKTITLFLFRSPDAGLRPRDPANPEARWVPRESVAELLSHPADARFFTHRVLPLLDEA